MEQIEIVFHKDDEWYLYCIATRLLALTPKFTATISETQVWQDLRELVKTIESRNG